MARVDTNLRATKGICGRKGSIPLTMPGQTRFCAHMIGMLLTLNAFDLRSV
jgi:hypothetical protein